MLISYRYWLLRVINLLHARHFGMFYFNVLGNILLGGTWPSITGHNVNVPGRELLEAFWAVLCWMIPNLGSYIVHESLGFG